MNNIVNSVQLEERSQASFAVKSGTTTVGKKTAYQTLAQKNVRSQLDPDSASQDDAWSHDSQRSPHKLQAKGTPEKDDDARRHKSRSLHYGECLNDDIIDIKENDTPPIVQPSLVRTVTASDQKGTSSPPTGAKRQGARLGVKGHARELSVKTGRARLRSDRSAAVVDDDKNTVYDEYSDLHSPAGMMIRRTQQNSPIGQVHISSTTQSRVVPFEKQTKNGALTTPVDYSGGEPPIDELINSISEDHQAAKEHETKENVATDEIEQSEEFFMAAQKPLPLKRIARQQVYQRSQRVSKPTIQKVEPVGRNDRFIGGKVHFGGSQRNSQTTNKTPLAIDTRVVRQDLLRSPFRQNNYLQKNNGRNISGRSGQNSNRKIGQNSRSSNKTQKGKGSLETSKYDLSPTTTNLLSQKSGNPSGANISIFATSFNKLPSVVKKQNQVELVKKLFKPEDQPVQTMMATGSSSYFPPSSFINKEQSMDVSMMSLLQQVAKISAKQKKYKRVMLNEQSSFNLPVSPSLSREMEAMQQAVEENNHIKIMGDINPLFVMQPNTINMVGKQLNQKSRQEQYQVMITSSKKLELINCDEDTAQSNTPKLAHTSSQETDVAIQNLIDMQDLADKLSIVLSNQTSSNQIQKLQSPQEKSANEMGRVRRQSDDTAFHKSRDGGKPMQKMMIKEQRLSLAPSVQKNTRLVQSPSSQYYTQQQQSYIAQTLQAERSSTGPASVQRSPHGSPHRSPLPSLRNRDLQGRNRLKTLNLTSVKPTHNLTSRKKSKQLTSDVQFGQIEKSFRYFENYTEKQKQQILQLAQQAKSQPKKPKKGLAFKNLHQKQPGGHLVSFGKKNSGDIYTNEQFNSTLGSTHLGDDKKACQTMQVPLMFQVTSPSGVSEKDQLLFDRNDGKQTTVTLYPVDFPQNSQIELPSSGDKSLISASSPSRLNSRKGLRHRFNMKEDDDDRESVKIKDANILNFSAQCKMQLTVQTPARGRLNSQESNTAVSQFDKASVMTKLNRRLLNHHDHLSSPAAAAATDDTGAGFTMRPLQQGKPVPQFAHQNSNQNLYNKQVTLKFPHKSTTRKVLMKVQGKSSRRKQVPSIPFKYRMLSNDSEQELQNLADLPDVPLSLSPGFDESEISPLPDLTGYLTTAKNSTGNPFQVHTHTLQKQAEPLNVEMTSKEFDLDRPMPESDLLTESKKLLKIQQQQQQLLQNQENLVQQSSGNQLQMPEPPQHLPMVAPRVTLTSRLSKDKQGNSDDKDLKIGNRSGVPMTKREFLELYKQSVATSIKEQKKVNKEILQQKRHMLRRRSSAIEHQRVIQDAGGESNVKTGHWPTLELEGGTDPNSPSHAQYFGDQPPMRGNDFLKSAAAHERRFMGPFDLNSVLPMGPIADPNQKSAVFKTFQTSSYRQRAQEHNVTDSIETQEGMIGSNTLKLPKDQGGILNPQIDKILSKRVRDGEVTSLSSRESDIGMASGIVSNTELPSGQDSICQPDSPSTKNLITSDSRPTQPPHSNLARKRFDEIEKLEQDSDGIQKQLEMARQEFAKHKPCSKRVDKALHQTEQLNGRKGSYVLSAVSSKDIKPYKNGKKQGGYKASYMPTNKLDKKQDKGYIVEKNNEDIQNLLTPDV